MTQKSTKQPVALISGASKGLGFTLAGFLAGRGYDLIITARDPERLARAGRSLEAQGVLVQSIAGDVANPDHRRRLANAVRAYGHLDILINNASTLGPTPMPNLIDYDLGDFRQALEVNALAPLALVQALHPFLSQSNGLIVNLSSDAAIGGYESWGGYGAGKAALDLISLTLAKELQDDGVGVVSVDPGDMRTDMHQDAFPGQDISDIPLPEETLPFWAWVFGQDPADISGRRFQAQAELWEVSP